MFPKEHEELNKLVQPLFPDFIRLYGRLTLGSEVNVSLRVMNYYIVLLNENAYALGDKMRSNPHTSEEFKQVCKYIETFTWVHLELLKALTEIANKRGDLKRYVDVITKRLEDIKAHIMGDLDCYL